jgi:hypothetical protein
MWKKKLREYKGRNYKYSLRKKLHREKKTTDDFEAMLHSLTLEEVIGLKLELAASHINNKLLPRVSFFAIHCKRSVSPFCSVLY